MKSHKIYILIFITGLCWASCSDFLISGLEKDTPHFYLECLRMVNNVLLFGITAFFLYKNIQKQQHQLKISEAQYRSLFESNPNPMWLFHRETYVFVAVNDAAVAKYGFCKEEFLKMVIWDIRPSEDIGPLMATLKTSHPDTSEMGMWRHIKKSGEVFWVSITMHDITFDQQRCSMVMATDMTEIVTNEQKLRLAYQNEKDLNNKLEDNYQVILSQHATLQEIAWSNSHELRKPVCSVLGLVGLLKEAATEEEIRLCLVFMETCTEELDQIIQKTIIKISKLETSEHFRKSVGRAN
jgi:PAS domain S-box-containing protein